MNPQTYKHTVSQPDMLVEDEMGVDEEENYLNN